ncbi:MAG TPA: HEAT repeat domain-containing protein [Verrucomicrobiota bacterium]|nr:HEAT repeat domain-containing protein [Verrucomicrobiota bacterium]HNU51666.1 HEAT repeat domain-containing protein [Verrucomicrobiota bacterium]
MTKTDPHLLFRPFGGLPSPDVSYSSKCERHPGGLTGRILSGALAAWIGLEGWQTASRWTGLEEAELDGDGVIAYVGADLVVAGKPLDYWLFMRCQDPGAAAVSEAESKRLVPLLADRFAGMITNHETGLVTPRFPEATRSLSLYALMRMGTNAAAAVPALAQALGSADRRTCLLAAQTLGCIGPASASAVPQLTNRLRTSKGDYQRTVIKALGRIGPPARVATPALSAALDSGDESAVLAAAGALWAIEHDSAMVEPVLVRLAANGSEELRPKVLALLGEVRAGQR